MAEIATNTYFDRRVPEGLMNALRGGGFAHSLVEYGRSGQYGLDLALRANPKTSTSRATLYVGTTKALDLMYSKSKGFKYSVHPSWQKGNGWKSDWQKWQSEDMSGAQWPDVERFVEACINAVARDGKYLKEGIVQAGISRFGDGNPYVVDREAVVGYSNQPVKDALLKAMRRPLRTALKTASEAPGKGWLKPSLRSAECDALAISDNGDLLAMEIKPETAGPVVACAPLQAWQYSRQFQAWADECATSGVSAQDILLGMYGQCWELGLSVGPQTPRLMEKIVVVPVVAVRPGYNDRLRRRFATVVQTIRAAGLDSPEMQFFKVNLVGRLDPFDPLEPGSWA